MINRKDYRALAAVCEVRDRETEDNYDAAKRALIDAGPLALDGLIEQLRVKFNSFFVDQIIECDDPKTVLFIKQYFRGNNSYLLSAYGLESKVETFLAKHDPMVRKKIEESERNEKEKLAKARDEVALYNEAAMLKILQELSDLYFTMPPNSPKIKRLEPIATAIGERLDGIGGIKEMRRIFHQLSSPGASGLEARWRGIGEWM